MVTEPQHCLGQLHLTENSFSPPELLPLHSSLFSSFYSLLCCGDEVVKTRGSGELGCSIHTMGTPGQQKCPTPPLWPLLLSGTPHHCRTSKPPFQMTQGSHHQRALLQSGGWPRGTDVSTEIAHPWGKGQTLNRLACSISSLLAKWKPNFIH